MKYTHYLYIASLVFLFACSSEEQTLTDQNGNIDNGEIMLSAGIAEGKAATRTGAEDNHANHQTLTTGTKINLRVSGTWTGHGDDGTIVQTTTATVGAETSEGSKHNTLTCSPILYWDDYGSAASGNTAGRSEGLTIYGATINGLTTAIAVYYWNAMTRNVPSDQSILGNYPSDYDLLISNNVKTGTGDGTYLFEARNSGKILEFKHALSKITVNLKAGAGFRDLNGDSEPDFANSQENDPVVTLTSNNASTSYTEWAYREGKVNVETGAVSDISTPSVIKMYQRPTPTTGYTVTKEALVMPGSEFKSDDAIILRIDAVDNIFYVTAEKIRTAINASTHNSDGAYSLEAGKNYIINITINQTGINVTATVANWTDVSAEEVAPVINVSGNLGGEATAFDADFAFSLYRSTSTNDGYSSATGSYYGADSEVIYTKSTDKWTMAPLLYWPTHNTYYQFRGVWPQTGTGTGEQTYPRVEAATHSGTNYQVIKVKNVAYSAGSFPSDLQIARPAVPNAAQNCGNNEPEHTKKNLYTEGICAREGVINLTFNYMMSQVEVNLSTTTDDNQVNLINAKVELVNVHNTGDVKLGDREVIPTGETGSYTLDVGTTANKRLSAIVPQNLAYTTALASDNVKFRITIYKDGDTSQIDDIYYADINPILKSESSEKVAPNGKWESGVHYVYNLKLSKTEVKVTATLATWTTVNATQDIWF